MKKERGRLIGAPFSPRWTVRWLCRPAPSSQNPLHVYKTFSLLPHVSFYCRVGQQPALSVSFLARRTAAPPCKSKFFFWRHASRRGRDSRRQPPPPLAAAAAARASALHTPNCWVESAGNRRVCGNSAAATAAGERALLPPGGAGRRRGWWPRQPPPVSSGGRRRSRSSRRRRARVRGLPLAFVSRRGPLLAAEGGTHGCQHHAGGAPRDR